MDVLRREPEAEGTPVSVTLIQPASVNPPFFSNARTKVEVKPKGAPPAYGLLASPDCRAGSVRGQRTWSGISWAAGAMIVGQRLTPSLLGWLLRSSLGFRLQETGNIRVEGEVARPGVQPVQLGVDPPQHGVAAGRQADRGWAAVAAAQKPGSERWWYQLEG